MQRLGIVYDQRCISVLYTISAASLYCIRSVQLLRIIYDHRCFPVLYTISAASLYSIRSVLHLCIVYDQRCPSVLYAISAAWGNFLLKRIHFFFILITNFHQLPCSCAHPIQNFPSLILSKLKGPLPHYQNIPLPPTMPIYIPTCPTSLCLQGTAVRVVLCNF